jgi:hypothetical protein
VLRGCFPVADRKREALRLADQLEATAMLIRMLNDPEAFAARIREVVAEVEQESREAGDRG